MGYEIYSVSSARCAGNTHQIHATRNTHTPMTVAIVGAME